MSRFSILMYHMVRQPESRKEGRYACPPDRFESHLRFLADHHPVISLAEACEHLLGDRKIAEGSVVITFDDGFEDNYTNAFPILEKYRVPATIFLATGTMEGTNRWMQTSDYPSRKMLTWDQAREMAESGITFGSHSVTHPSLPTLTGPQLRRELRNSKATIERQLPHRCDFFAYPYGHLNDETVTAVREAGYLAACSTRSGFNNSNRDPFVLHRIEVYGTDGWRQLKRKLTFGTNESSPLFPLKYYFRRLTERLSGASS